MTGAGPLAIREVGRRVDRDVKSVHGDVSALLKAGVIDRGEDGGVVFPYDELHVGFVLRGVAEWPGFPGSFSRIHSSKSYRREQSPGF